MRRSPPLTTTEAARVAAVAPTTLKRWADQGLVPFSRTAGGHRRFERSAVERLLQDSAQDPRGGEPAESAWVRCLVEGQRHAIDGRLLEARHRLGAWSLVAEELAEALRELGEAWAAKRLSIAEEHVASEALTRALARVGDSLPTPHRGPQCLLACAQGDDHTLGLALTELCLREAGWSSVWLGRFTPLREIEALIRAGRISLVAMSASTFISDRRRLEALATSVGRACRQAGVQVVFGGSGAWPSRPTYGRRMSSFRAFQEYLAEEAPWAFGLD